MSDADRQHLRRAARVALRGHGGAEPNPCVGCVIVDGRGVTVGWGYHRRCGEAHAERAALHRAGSAARGATAYVTLAPCHGTGRTGPCTEALIAAGVARVVYAVDDPHPKADGGVEHLRRAGVAVERVPCREAELVSAPFVERVRTGLPWVVAKWAQSLDGRIATASGESAWISSERSRRLVHRERGRVDAILTGIGTVQHDDPLLTARGVRMRRVATRVVVDPRMDIALSSKLVNSAREFPLVVAVRDEVLEARPVDAEALRGRGVQLIGLGTADGAGGPQGDDTAIDLRGLLTRLVSEHSIATILVEAGGVLLGSLLRQRLVNEALVFIAPILLGDRGRAAVVGVSPERLADALRLHVIDRRLRGQDIMLRCLTSVSAPR